MHPIDTSKTVKIAYSRIKLCFFLVGCWLFAAGFAWFITSDIRMTLFHAVLVYLSFAFSGGGSLLLLGKLLKGEAALTLSPDGIHDPRFTNGAIPWTAVDGVSGYKMQRQNIVYVGIAPVFRLGEHMKRSARWMNFGQTPTGLRIGLAALAIKQEELFRLIEAYASAYSLRR